MQEGIGLKCSECNKTYELASSLLKHFAQHASTDILKGYPMCEKRPVPDLFPIHTNVQQFTPNEKSEENETDSGFEDSLNLLTMYLVTADHEPPTKRQKYTCTYCLQNFDWDVDLKRHVLVHTGQSPFVCTNCEATFTKKSHLIKHISKQHPIGNDMVLPGLQLIKSKQRKQDKSSIKQIKAQ